MFKRPLMLGLTSDLLAKLSGFSEGPCLSLYLSTHRTYPEHRQDPTQYRNLVKELGALLQQGHSDAQVRELLVPFEALAMNAEFWKHSLDGLVVFGAPGFFQTLRIPQTVTDSATVGDHFQTAPLRRFLQSIDRYQVLGLSLTKVRMFEGNRYALD